MDRLNPMLLGAIAVTSLVAGLFFLRFWRESRDRFFLLFALSFFVEGGNRIVQALSPKPQEGSPAIYLVRLVSFLLIIGAIIDKNRSARTVDRSPPGPTPGANPPR
jgi:uncharacterized membrane protein HdeD (DUF308 family)